MTLAFTLLRELHNSVKPYDVQPILGDSSRLHDHGRGGRFCPWVWLGDLEGNDSCLGFIQGSGAMRGCDRAGTVVDSDALPRLFKANPGSKTARGGKGEMKS